MTLPNRLAGDAGRAYVLLGQPRSAGNRPFDLGSAVEQRDLFGVDEQGDALGAAVTIGDLNREGLADGIVGSAGEAFPDEARAGVVITLQCPLGNGNPAGR